MSGKTRARAIGVPVNSIDVVMGIEGMSLPRIIMTFAIKTETLEKHDGYIHPAVPCRDDPLTHPVKVRLIEEVQVKLGAAIQGGAWAGTLIGQGRILVLDRARRIHLRCRLPRP